MYIKLTVLVVFNALNAIHMPYLLMDHANNVKHILLDVIYAYFKNLQFIALSVLVIIISQEKIAYPATLQVEHAMYAITVMDTVSHVPQL